MNPEASSTASLRARIGAALHRRPRLRRAGAGLAILAAGVAVAAGLIATTPQTPAEEPVEKAWPVSVEIVEPATRAPVLSAYGRVEAAATTSLEAPLGAPVAAVQVREGERVEAGRLLVRLDDAEARLALAAREAEAAEARAELASMRNAAQLAAGTADEHEAVAQLAAGKLARFEALFDQKMIARDLLDQVRREAGEARIALAERRSALADFPHRIARAEAQVQGAEVAAERARIELARTRVVAPFAGPVVAVHVARGDQVMTGMPLVSLVDETSVELRVPVPARDAQRLRRHLDAGRAVTARAELAGAPRTLTLARLSGEQRDGRSVVDAFFTLAPEFGAAVGQVVDVRVSLPAEQQVIAVPVQALYENARVYRIEDDRLVGMAAEVLGEIDMESGYRMLVRVPGLESGQRIITTQLPRAITGLKVTPVGERLASHPEIRTDADAG